MENMDNLKNNLKNEINIVSNFLRSNNFSDKYITKLKNRAINKKLYFIIIACLNILIERARTKPRFTEVSIAFLGIILACITCVIFHAYLNIFKSKFFLTFLLLLSLVFINLVPM